MNPFHLVLQQESLTSRIAELDPTPDPGAATGSARTFGPTARLWSSLLLVLVVGGGGYGLLMGLWHGPRLALYVAIKLPLVLILTAALTLLLNWILALLFGLRLGFQQVALLTFQALATAALLLFSLAPVAGLFSLSAPLPDPADRTTYFLLYLMHTLLVGGAGLVGTAALWQALRRVCPRRGPALRIYLAWLLAFALVGGEVAWALRPFIGSIYMPVTFLRQDALDGNVYEPLITEILPELLGLEDDHAPE